MRTAGVVFAVAICGLAAGLTARQTAAPPAQGQTPPIFRSRTDVVQLDVSVLDEKRRPVRGLTLADFTVVEDGKAQELVAVSEVDLPDEYARPPVWARAAPADVSSNDVGDKRLFAIVVDVAVQTPRTSGPRPPGLLTWRPDPGLVDAVSEIVHGIIDRLGPRDMAAILGSVCNQAFTDDRERLNTAIDSIRPGAAPCRSNFGRSAWGGVQGMPHLLIRDLAEYLSVVPQRRKAIVYIGRGYNTSGGRSNPRSSDVLDTVWFAQQSNVNIYGISPYMAGALRGRRGGGSPLDGLLMLAEETGGFAITDPLKYDAGLDQLFVENGSYYMLGYKTTHPEMDGKFRKLSVKVAGHKNATVRTRSMSYRPKVDAKKIDPPAAAVPSAATEPRLSGLLPNLDVTFDAVAMPFARPGETVPAVALVTEITEPVGPGTSRVTQQLDLRMLIYDETGQVRGDGTIRAGLDERPTTDESIRYGVVSRIDLAPGRYSVRLVAHNSRTDKLGSTEFPLLVPDFARDVVSLSGIAVSMPERPPMTIFGRLEPLLTMLPTSQRAFTTSERASAFLQVYQGGNGPLQPVSVAVQVLDAQGTSVFDLAEPLPVERFSAFRAADLRVTLPLERLRSGSYLLTVEAALGARRTPRRDVRFSIR